MITTHKTDTRKDVDFNILLADIGGGVYRLEMPDEDGQLHATARSGYLVRWPVNPHFTGRASIIALLEDVDLMQNKTII